MGIDFAKRIRILITLADDINQNVMQHALDRTIKRYSYFASDSCDLVIRFDKADELCFEISHDEADGFSCMRFLKTLLYTYYSELFGENLDSTGIILPESELLPGEDEKPGLIPGPVGIEGRTIVEDPFVLPEAENAEKQYCYYKVRIPESNYLDFAKRNNGSPLSLTSDLVFKMLMKEFPDNDKSIYANIAANIRRALHADNSRHNLSYTFIIEHIPELLNLGFDELGVKTREQIKQQSTDEAMVGLYNYTMVTGGKIVAASDPMEKYALLNELMGVIAPKTTYALSYVGKSDWGSLEPYIKEMYSMAIATDLMIEMNCADGFFDICWIQSFSSSRYVDSFKHIVEENGIPCTVEGPISIINL